MSGLRSTSCRLLPGFLKHTTRKERRRTYYSIHHPEPAPYPPIQDKILSAALSHVPAHGFTRTALRLGAQSTGYLDVSVQLFPRGAFDLIHYHLVTSRLALKDRVQFPSSKQFQNQSTSQKVKTLAWHRLRMNVEPTSRNILPHWQAALAQMSLLENIPASLRELHSLVDEIWYLAGDTAVDFSWYTKRASLAGVYASSEVFMTTDTSKNFTATEEFLERRLEDVHKAGNAVGGSLEYVGFWAGNSFDNFWSIDMIPLYGIWGSSEELDHLSVRVQVDDQCVPEQSIPSPQPQRK